MNLRLAKAVVAVDDIRRIIKASIFENFPEYKGNIQSDLECIESALSGVALELQQNELTWDKYQFIILDDNLKKGEITKVSSYTEADLMKYFPVHMYEAAQFFANTKHVYNQRFMEICRQYGVGFIVRIRQGWVKNQ
jgi:hypothetical protein